MSTGASPSPTIDPDPVTASTSLSSLREIAKCFHCSLTQFVHQSRTCRRCHQSVDPPPEPPSPSPFPPSPEPIQIKSIAECLDRPEIVIRLDKSLPLVVCWLRMRMRLSQRDLGKLLDAPRTYISKIENGKSMPTYGSAVRIAEVLGVSMEKMMRCCEYLETGK